MFDGDTKAFFCLLLIGIIWIIAYVFVVYDLIRSISRMARPSKVWRHIIESFVLIGAGFGWLSFGDVWVSGNSWWRPAVSVTGVLVLLAYVYSSYRKRVDALWLEGMVRVTLLVGIIGMVGFTVMTGSYELFLIVGMPVVLLFTNALLADYRRSGRPENARADD